MPGHHWPPPHPSQQYHHHQARIQYRHHASYESPTRPNQAHPTVGDARSWWMVVMHQQQSYARHYQQLQQHYINYYGLRPPPPFPYALPPPPVWHRRQTPNVDGPRQGVCPVEPSDPSPLRLPPSQADSDWRQLGSASVHQPTADQDSCRRTPSYHRGHRSPPRSCPPLGAVGVSPAGTSPGQHASCTVGRPNRLRHDNDELLTNSLQKRRRVSRTRYVRLPTFSEDERDASSGQPAALKKSQSFTDALLATRMKSGGSVAFRTPERSVAREDDKLQSSGSRTPAPTRRLSVIKEASGERNDGLSTQQPLRSQVSPQTDPRSWYAEGRTPSSSSPPRINPAEYGCGVPDDDGGFTTDVERGMASEEDIGSTSSEEEEEESETSDQSDEDSSEDDSCTSDHEIVQRGDEIIRRRRKVTKRRKRRSSSFDFVDYSEEFNTGLFATADEPTLRFKKAVTRRFGAKLKHHPMFREDVQNDEREHVEEYQM